MLLGIDVDDRAVPRKGQVDGAGLTAAHLHGFVQHGEGLPAAVIAVFAVVGRVQLVDVKVFLVDVEDGQAERDVPVMPDRHGGQ
ncbi:hypothetical protein ACU4HD_43550 [Cupriavidus basilensis]